MTRKNSEMEIKKVVAEAFEAAKSAETKFRALHGEPMYCGFAWVNIKPGNCAMANFLKKAGHSHTSYTGGVNVWNPGGSMTQSMSIKEEGATAFAAVLRAHGVNAYMQSRAD